MPRTFTYYDDLYESYREQVYGARERFRHVLISNCWPTRDHGRHARAYGRYLHAHQKNNLLARRVIFRLMELYPEGKIHTVRNGKVIATRQAA